MVSSDPIEFQVCIVVAWVGTVMLQLLFLTLACVYGRLLRHIWTWLTLMVVITLRGRGGVYWNQVVRLFFLGFKWNLHDDSLLSALHIHGGFFKICFTIMISHHQSQPLSRSHSQESVNKSWQFYILGLNVSQQSVCSSGLASKQICFFCTGLDFAYIYMYFTLLHTLYPASCWSGEEYNVCWHESESQLFSCTYIQDLPCFHVCASRDFVSYMFIVWLDSFQLSHFYVAYWCKLFA